jgi:hypothetical protein
MLNVWRDPDMKLDEDGKPLKNADGDDVVPDEGHQSMLFRAMSLYAEAYEMEVEFQKAAGKIVGPPKKGAVAPAGSIVASNGKVCTFIKDTIGDTDKKRASPVLSLKVEFDKESKALKRTIVCDKTKPFKSERGTEQYEPAKIDGKPITAINAHKFFRTPSTIDGILNAGGICFSNLGISAPMKVSIIVVDPPKSGGPVYSTDDIYGEAPATAAATTSAASAEDVDAAIDAIGDVGAEPAEAVAPSGDEPGDTVISMDTPAEDAAAGADAADAPAADVPADEAV